MTPRRHSFSHAHPRREEYRQHVADMLAKGVRPHFFADWLAMTECLEGRRSTSSVNIRRRKLRTQRGTGLMKGFFQ